ncbi:hypothetical protein Tco_0846221 [Tanacetum coccineum]
MSSYGRLQFRLTITGAHLSFSFNNSNALWHSSLNSNGVSFSSNLVIRKRFEFKIRRRFFKRYFDLVIGVKVIFSNGGSSVSDSNSEFSSTIIAMNSSNSAKSFSSRVVPSIEWRISLPSSRRASKSSSQISSMTSILKHVSSIE